MDEGNDSICKFPTATDVLADILVRLPPNVRRRLRLVCRLWRAVVDQRTSTDMQARGKILAFTTDDIAYVVDVLSPGRPRALPWPKDRGVGRSYKSMSVVGTCNGIVCMCDDWEPGGALTLANPSTGEGLDLPLLPLSAAAAALLCRGSMEWHQMYSFAYHPMTGRYKVVHVPSHFDPSICWEPSTVHVFTLGEASWRDVHAGPNARCALGACHLADVDGTVYWMTEYTGRVVALDLEDESITPTEPLPVTGLQGDCWLTKLDGRLGVVVGGDDLVTVWLLEGERWSRRYIVEAHRLRQPAKERLRWRLTRPHFAYGDYVLTHGGSGNFMCGRKTSEAASSQGGVVQIRHNERVDAVLCLRYCISQTFAYIETKESLSIYREALVTHGVSRRSWRY